MTALPLPRIVVGRRRWQFAGLVTIGVAQGALAVVWSLAVSEALRRAGQGHGAGAVVLGGLVALAVATAALLGAERVLAERLGQSWVNQVRVTVFEHVTRSPVREHWYSTGATTLRLVGDASALRRWASLGLARLAVAVPMLAGAITALVLVAPLIGLVVTVVVAAGAVVTGLLTPKLRAANRVSRRRRARIAARVTELVSARLVMQAFGQEQREVRRLRRQGARLAESMVERAGLIGVVRAVVEATTLLSMVAALVLAATAGAGAAELGSAIAVLGMMATPLRDLSRVTEYHAAARVAREKLVELLARPVRRTGVAAAPSGAGRLELRGVCLDGLFGPLHATAGGGATVALTGPNGSGKSTLLSVLAGLERPTTGAVLLDGTPLHDVDPVELRKLVSLVTPDLPLLRASIADNIRYAEPRADEARVAEVVTRCGLDDVLRTLPDGIHTRVGEGGRGLSTGQRQRVAMARALLPNPRVLLLDEADAHLDRAALATVDRVLAGFPGTAVVVTHRPDSTGAATAVWSLERGQLRVAERNSVWAGQL
ncbi:ATP-binding cassette domain-containing protein [Amycolatopsis lurida]